LLAEAVVVVQWVMAVGLQSALALEALQRLLEQRLLLVATQEHQEVTTVVRQLRVLAAQAAQQTLARVDLQGKGKEVLHR
jgi:hypothetical protein